LELTLFSNEVMRGLEPRIFRESRLGKLHSVIPFKELASHFRYFKSNKPQGCKAFFTLEGGLGLMFLKHELGFSDEKLIERLNSDWQLQLFCGIRLLGRKIKDKDIVGRWRRFFGTHMDMDALQDKLAQHWSTDMDNTDILLDDATCYESDVKYPTDVKLLYDCSEWLFKQIMERSNLLGLRAPKKDHYNKLRKRMRSYLMMKKKRRKKRKRLIKSLLHWVDKWQQHLQGILDKGRAFNIGLKDRFYKRLRTTRIVYFQQLYMFENNVRKVANRIVSLYKPYLRPIVRGKERKPVEFGAKAHISQVDGINFIEHLNFNAFHEGNRMLLSLANHQKRFGKCSKYGADRIYATNRNRKSCKALDIQTSFVRKGAAAKDETQRQQMRAILSKERSTRLEGSFGTEKRHYLFGRVRARLETTEIAWIFFSIHTANAVRMSKKPRAA